MSYMNNYITALSICEFVAPTISKHDSDNHIEKTFNHSAKYKNYIKIKFNVKTKESFSNYLLKTFKAYQEIIKDFTKSDEELKLFINDNFKLIHNTLKRFSNYYFS